MDGFQETKHEVCCSEGRDACLLKEENSCRKIAPPCGGLNILVFSDPCTTESTPLLITASRVCAIAMTASNEHLLYVPATHDEHICAFSDLLGMPEEDR